MEIIKEYITINKVRKLEQIEEFDSKNNRIYFRGHGREEKFSYNEKGNLINHITKEKNGTEKEIQYEHNKDGNIIYRNVVGKLTEKYKYNKNNQIILIENYDKDGAVYNHYIYDRKGRLILKVNSNNYRTEYEYYDGSREGFAGYIVKKYSYTPSKPYNLDEYFLTEKYDCKDNLIYLKTSLGREDKYKYDENNNLIYFYSWTADCIFEEKREYDKNNNLIRIVNNHGTEERKYIENRISEIIYNDIKKEYEYIKIN